MCYAHVSALLCVVIVTRACGRLIDGDTTVSSYWAALFMNSSCPMPCVRPGFQAFCDSFMVQGISEKLCASFLSAILS